MDKPLSASVQRDEQRKSAAKRRPGGQSAHVEQAVIVATLELLSQRGYEGVTTKEIAAQAGVNARLALSPLLDQSGACGASLTRL